MALVFLSLPVILGMQAVRAYTNRLMYYDGWVCAKVELENTPMGSVAFEEGRQALAHHVLDLGAWHGFQEVTLHPRPELEHFSFRFQIAEDGYLSIFLHADDSHRVGLCLSRRAGTPSHWFVVDEGGAFVESTPIAAPPRMGGDWLEATIETTASGVIAYIAGSQIRLDKPALTLNTIGFRGSLAPVYLDDLALQYRDGGVYRQDFSHSDRVWAGVGLLGTTWVGVLVFIGAWHWRRTRSLKKVLFAQLAVAFSASLLTGTSWAALEYTASHYPVRRTEVEQAWVAAMASVEETEMRTHFDASPEAFRILCLGTSQTFGTGAKKAADSYVQQLQNKLQEGHPDRAITCLSLGFRGADSSLLVQRYRLIRRDREPDLVVVDLGSNDRDSEKFRANLLTLARVNQNVGIPTVFVLEPNCPELKARERHNNTVMREVGRLFDIPVLDVETYLDERQNTGFLWWDFVHPTSYGHELIAEYLAESLTCLDLRNICKQ